MSASLYNDKTIVPDETMLDQDLKEGKAHLDSIMDFIKSSYGDVQPEWKHYGKKSGWILKLFNKKRNVLFVVPCEGYFRVAFTFGDKAIDKVYTTELPEVIKTQLAAAKKYAEGRTIQIDVRTDEDCQNINELIRIKLNP